MLQGSLQLPWTLNSVPLFSKKRVAYAGSPRPVEVLGPKLVCPLVPTLRLRQREVGYAQESLAAHKMHSRLLASTSQRCVLPYRPFARQPTLWSVGWCGLLRCLAVPVQRQLNASHRTDQSRMSGLTRPKSCSRLHFHPRYKTNNPNQIH